MHIGVLCDPASFHTQKWAQALQRLGASVTVFSFSDKKIPGIHCVQIKPWGGRLSYIAFLKSGKALAEALAEHRIDILNPINMTPYGIWAARSGFRPIAAVSMGADILEYPPKGQTPPSVAWQQQEHPGMLGKLANKLRYHFFRKWVKEALDSAALITGDNYVLIHAIRDGFDIPQSRLMLHRWGVEPSLFETSEADIRALRKQFGISPGQRVVLSPRGMKPIYQGDIILAAFRRRLEAGAQEKYIMMSAGYAISKEVKAQADYLIQHFPEQFHYEADVLPREQVLKLWSLVDMCISAPIYDGYSNALAEGRYAGAIPLVNRIPGSVEVMEHDLHGWFVDPFTPANLDFSLRHVLHNYETLQPRMAAANKDWIQKHSVMDVEMKAFLEKCEDLLA